ncbi:MAG: SpoIIE family protein phosphatase [Capsulimonadaceae bacterium]
MIGCKEIIENSPLAMAVTEGPGHKICFVSSAFCAMQGKRAGDIVGHPISDAIGDAEAPDVLALLDGVYRGEKGLTVKYLHYSTPGRVVNHKSYTAWCLTTVNEHSDGLVIHINDLTTPTNDTKPGGDLYEQNREIRQINEKLVLSAVRQQSLAEMSARSESRFRSLIRGLNAIVCEVDASTGTFTFVSERAESLLGYAIDQWHESGFWKRIIHPDDYEAAHAALIVDEPSRDGLEYTFRVAAADGSEIWLRNIIQVVRDSSGIIANRRCVIVDATDQQYANEALAMELERNRSIAEAMQYSILWPQPEKVFPGVRVAAFYEPAVGDALVGGDFFDAFKLPNHSIMLVVGDVTGKGLKAAARTVEVTFALRAFAQDYIDPGDMLRRINEFICDFHRDDEGDIGNALIVLSLVVVDPETGTLRAASAGAEPPLIIRAAGGVEDLAVKGLILGIDRNVSYGTVDVHLEFGDTLLMTTDGIPESRRGRDFFGYGRLLEAARKAAAMGTPHQIGTAILDSARAYTSGRFTDDICLLLTQRAAA